MTTPCRPRTWSAAALLATLVLHPWQARAATVSLPADAAIAPGQSAVSVELRIDDAGGVLAASFRILFDPSVVRVGAVQPGSLLASCTTQTNDRTPGELRLAFACMEELAGAGPLAEVAFERVAEGSTALAFAPGDGCVLNEGDPPCDARDGRITVLPDGGTPPPPTVGPPPCPGDCNGNGSVGVNELVAAVNVALERLPAASCPAADPDGDGAVGIDELVSAVRAALGGCPGR